MASGPAKAQPALDGKTSPSAATRAPLRARLPSNQALLRLRARRRPSEGEAEVPSPSADGASSIQAKSLDSVAEDRCEREAERIGDQIVGMGDGVTSADTRALPPISRLPPSALPASEPSRLPPTELSRDALASGGEPLPASSRAFFEARFGRDLSGVSIHRDSEAKRENEHLRARAFTYGAHIWLGESAALSDRRLMAHELTHVVQQTGPAPLAAAAPAAMPGPAIAAIQRDDLKSTASEILRTDYGRGFFLVQTPALGQATLRYRGQTWVTLTWRPETGRRLDDQNFVLVFPTDPANARLTLQLKTGFTIQAQVTQATEQTMADVSAGSLVNGRLEVAIEDGSPGQITTFGPSSPVAKTSTTPGTVLNAYRGDASAPLPAPHGAEQHPGLGLEEYPEPNHDRDDRYGDAESVPAAPRIAKQQVWIQKDQQAFEAFARAHADTDWAGITLPDGRVVAYALTERTLQALASRVRERDFSFDIQNDFPGSSVGSLFIRGQALSALADLDNLYFGDETMAAFGIEGDYEECEVFEMGGRSFGRKPLTHEQALARLVELDGKTAPEIAKLEIEPGRPFQLLRARGASARLHLLDNAYYQSRDSLLALPVSDPPLAIGVGNREMQVLDFEADRQFPDPRVQRFLEANPPSADNLQQEVVRRIEHAAQQILINSIGKSLPQFKAVADNDSDAALLVLSLQRAPERRRQDILQSLGVGEYFTPLGRLLLAAPNSHAPIAGPSATDIETKERNRISAIVADHGNAMKIIAGEAISGGVERAIDLAYFRERARATAAGMEAAIEQLRMADAIAGPAGKALYEGGAIGTELRRQAYRLMGFSHLDPEQYPHRGSQGLFPAALQAKAPAPLAEQLFANHAARHATVEDLKLAGKIAASVVIILASEGVGISVAAMWFGESAVAATVVSAVTFTMVDAIFQAAISDKPLDLSHPGRSAANLGLQAALNIAMFGFFKQLNAIFGAMSESGIRSVFSLSEGAFKASTAARLGAGGLRISAMGATFVTLNFEQFVITHNRAPDANEARHMAAEALLSLVLLEVGGNLAKAPLENIRIMARAKSLGVMAGEIDAHFVELRTLQRRIAATEFDPRRLGSQADGFANEYEQLLTRRRQLVEQLQSGLRTRARAEDVDSESGEELARIDASIQAIRQARLVQRAGIQPAGEPASAGEATEFTYIDTPANRQLIVDRFGAANAKVGGDGAITVRQPGQEPWTFRPAPAAPATPPATPAQADAPTAPADAPAATGPDDRPATPPEPEAPAVPAEPAAPDLAKPQAPARPAAPVPSAPTLQGAPTPDFFAQREALAVRRSELVRRGAALGLDRVVPDFGPGSANNRPMTLQELAVRTAAQTALARIGGLRTRAVRKASVLADQTRLVDAAEAAAAPEISRLADLAFDRHQRRLKDAGTSLDEVRTGALSSATDRQIGEALAELPLAQGLGVRQLRGVLYAYRGNGGERINMRRLFDMARSAAERNTVLDQFAQLMDAGISGAYEVLNTMLSSRNNWRGGAHVIDYAVNGPGVGACDRFEYKMTDTTNEEVRIYDILLKDGTRIQGKDWSNWFEGSLRSQFRRDVLIMTANFSQPTGLSQVRWVFRAPGPQTKAVIRETMRQALEDVMREFNLDEPRRIQLRDVFDRHQDLIEFWGAPTPAAPTTSAPSLPGAPPTQGAPPANVPLPPADPQ